MARAFLTGVYTMQEVADNFGVHSATVSGAVRTLGARHAGDTRLQDLNP